MNKKYWTRRAPIALVPLFVLVPLVGVAVRGSFDLYVLAEMLINLVLACILFFASRRQVARIEEGTLRFFSGIGLAEEDRIDLAAVSSVERPKPRYMVIRYGEGKSLGIESDKAVLNALAKDLSIFVGKKAGASEPEPKA